MDPIQILLDSLQALENRLLQALASVPAAAEVAGQPGLTFAVNACAALKPELTGTFSQFRTLATTGLKGIVESKREELKNTLTAEIKAELVKDSAYITASGLMKKEDHESAVKVAVDAEKAKIQPAVDAAMGAIKQTAERRKALVEDKTLTLMAASAMPDDALAGDDFKTKVGKVKERLTKLAEIKALAEDQATVTRVVGIPLTAEGDAEFNNSFSIWKTAAKGSGVAAPLNPGSVAPSDIAFV